MRSTGYPGFCSKKSVESLDWSPWYDVAQASDECRAGRWVGRGCGRPERRDGGRPATAAATTTDARTATPGLATRTATTGLATRTTTTGLATGTTATATATGRTEPG